MRCKRATGVTQAALRSERGSPAASPGQFCEVFPAKPKLSPFPIYVPLPLLATKKGVLACFNIPVLCLDLPLSC